MDNIVDFKFYSLIVLKPKKKSVGTVFGDASIISLMDKRLEKQGFGINPSKDI